MKKFRIFTGNLQQIKETIKDIAKEENVEVKFSQDIFTDINKQYGLFYKPKLFYFFYSPNLFDKDSLPNFLNKLKHTVVCIVEEEIDKRSYFYKIFKDKIETIGKSYKEKTLDDKVEMFYKDNNTIQYISQKEIVSFLHKLFYNYKHKEYRQTAGYCLNLVLTGKVKVEYIKKVFINERI